MCDALPPHSRPRPILPVAKRVRFGDDIPPHAPLASPIRDPGSSVRMPQNAPPSVPSTPTPFRCTTTGTSIVPLEPLAQHLEAWLTSRWLTRTIRLGYAIQFARRPPKFNGVSRDVGGSPEHTCLARGDCCPPGKGCNRAGPSSRDEAGVLQPLLHRTQERWWSSANPGSASLEPGFAQAPAPVPVTPLREVGVRILNYLDDWLILAQSREQLGDHRDLVLRHLSQLGLRVNWEKSKLSPVQRISFLGVELDSMSMTARLTEERAQAVLNCLSSFRGRNVVPLKQFQRLLGHMASAAAVTPLGLLHMRPLQHWLHSRVPRWVWHRGTLRVGISQQCHRSLSSWTDLDFLRAGVPLEQVSRHTVVTTDASSTGWGATCNGQAASGLWTGPAGQLASGLTQVCISPSEPTRTDTVQAQGGRGAGPAGCAPLAHPDLVSRTPHATILNHRWLPGTRLGSSA